MQGAVRCYIAEFIGTFMLVFVGTAAAAVQGIPGGAGLLGVAGAFGGVLILLVMVVGPISGCHLNPAVTLPMAASGRLKWSLAPGYIICQMAGAVAASVVLLLLVRTLPSASAASLGLGANGNPLSMPPFALAGFEVLLTAMFLFVIFTATHKDTTPGFETTKKDETPGFAAISIGLYLFVAVIIAGQMGAASMNPARSFGPAVVEGGASLSVLWVFIVGPVIGGLLGMLLYKLVHPPRRN